LAVSDITPQQARVSSTEPAIDLTSDEVVIALERLDSSGWVDSTVKTKVEVIDEQTRTIIDLTADEPWRAGYFRTDQEILDLEQKLIGLIDPEVAALSGLVMVETDAASPLTDITRSLEMKFGWEDLPVYMHGYEHAAPGSYLVDFDRPTPRIVFAGRGVRGPMLGPQSSGSQVIDSVEHVTAAEVRSYYGIPDLHACFDVTTVYRRKGVERAKAQKDYFAYIFLVMTRVAFEANVPYLMAYMNPLSKMAVDRLGYPTEPLCGREIQAPLVEGYEYNADFQATAIPADFLYDTLFNPNHALAAFVEPLRSVNVPMVNVRVAADALVVRR
jgi:hypothetical protein